MFKKIVIFGVGLIGGSFALALKNANKVSTTNPTALQIVGVGRSRASLERALELGIIDVIAPSIADAMLDADLVLIAAPVAQTTAILLSIVPYLQATTIVTDAGSTKSDVEAAARAVLRDKVGQFVPAHPIAGRESNGPDAAIAHLYMGKKVVITPLPENAIEDVAKVADAWRQCGAMIHQLSAQ
ncbi:MAG: prephenate dehydrogenase/arogenate dehydrogenase family protein, partial [Glaciimonas sp.]|nr:prephenate dehydrogenase/arogenate dehydrogenase family protein [Glaciimonas sp.]